MPPDRERNEAGEFVTRRDPEDIFEVMTPGEPHTASELADLIGWPRRSVFDALNGLADANRVTKKKVTARTVIWIRSSEES
jgi:predicted transcriptional regulator